MRKLVHPKPIKIKTITTKYIENGKEIERPYEFTFKEFFSLMAQLPAWRSGGNNDEFGARLGSLMRAEDMVDSTEPGNVILLENDDHETILKIMRDSKLSDVIMPQIAGKAMRYVYDWSMAERVDDKKGN